MTRRKIFFCFILLYIFFMGSQSSFAAVSNDDLMERLNHLSVIIQKQQQEIDRLRQELEKQKQAIVDSRESGPEEVKKAVKAEVDQVEKKWKEWLPKWVQRIKVSGDLRLRYEGIYGREQRQADLTTRSIPTRDRYRIRARLFFDGKVTDEVWTQFMICTNQDGNLEATTTNQSFNNDFNDKGIYLHRAYAAYRPKWFQGLELTAGKFANTFVHTDIMWDPDVNPEGIYERYQHEVWKDFRPFIQLGQMAVHEVNNETDDPALYINQAGFDWKIGGVTWTLAGSYYDWANLHNTRYLHLAQYKGGGGNTFILDPTDPTKLQYRYDYDLLEAISFIEFKLGAFPFQLMFDYIVNTSEKVPGGQDTAFFAGFKLGEEKKKGDWSLFYKYARIEKDALVGSMNDQDFYGANRKGHKVMFRYMLFDRLRFGTAFFYTDPVTPWDPASPNFANERSREHENRLQGEFVLKF